MADAQFLFYQKGESMSSENNPLIEIAVRRLDRGHENAKPLKNLAEELYINERTLRELLEQARADGYLICNDMDGKGYYLADTLDDVDRQYRRDYNRAMALLVRLKPMRRMLREAGRLKTKKEMQHDQRTDGGAPAAGD